MTARSFTEAFAADPLDLDALTELEAAATPGPWRADTAQRGDCVVWGPNRDEFLSNIGHVIVPMPLPEDDIVSFDAEEHNTRLIAAARTALPSLIEAARDRERAIRWAVTLEGQNAAALQLHKRSVLTAAELTPGRCWYCERPHLELLTRYRAHFNGALTKVWLHDHADPEPCCITCAGSDSSYDGSYAGWPCATAVALGAALTGSTE